MIHFLQHLFLFSVSALAADRLPPDIPIMVEGTCETRQFNPRADIIYQHRSSFNLVVSNEFWTITLMDDNPNEDYRRVSGDGTNCYYLVVSEKGVKNSASKGETVGTNVAGGIVLPRPVPNLATYPQVGPIWITFASRAYFRSASTTAKRELDIGAGLFTHSLGDVELFRVVKPATWTFGVSELPVKVIYFEVGRWKTRVFPDGSYFSRPFPEPYENGFTNSIFTIDSVANEKNISIPKTSRFLTFAPKENGSSSNDLWLRFEYTIQTTNWAVVDRPIAVFDVSLPGPTLINEARFVEEPHDPRAPFAYMASLRIPLKESVKKSQAYMNSLSQTVPFDTQLRTYKNMGFFAGGVLVLIAAPLILFRSLFREKKETT